MDARQELLKAKNTEGVEYAIYPYTTTKCVTNDDGENLDVILSKLSSNGNGGNVDLTDYYNKNEVDSLLQDKADADDIPSVKGLATETYVTSKIAEAQLSGGDVEVDLSSYYNKTEIDHLLAGKADDGDIPSLDGYAKKTDIPDVSVYAKKSDIPDVSTLASKEDLSNKVDKVAGKGLFSGSYNDLTDKPSIPSIEGLTTEAYVNNAIKTAVGTKDISSIGDGTIKGAIVYLSMLTANLDGIAATLDVINRMEV